jgi:hypothetical protein
MYKETASLLLDFGIAAVVPSTHVNIPEDPEISCKCEAAPDKRSFTVIVLLTVVVVPDWSAVCGASVTSCTGEGRSHDLLRNGAGSRREWRITRR